MQRVRAQQAVASAPAVVHCSAGVGRTAVVCALTLCMESIDDESELSVCGLAKHVRTERPAMLQSALQYEALYRCVMDYMDMTAPGWY